jgi:hypothetical protein
MHRLKLFHFGTSRALCPGANLAAAAAAVSATVRGEVQNAAL